MGSMAAHDEVGGAFGSGSLPSESLGSGSGSGSDESASEEVGCIMDSVTSFCFEALHSYCRDEMGGGFGSCSLGSGSGIGSDDSAGEEVGALHRRCRHGKHVFDKAPSFKTQRCSARSLEDVAADAAVVSCDFVMVQFFYVLRKLCSHLIVV